MKYIIGLQILRNSLSVYCMPMYKAISMSYSIFVYLVNPVYSYVPVMCAFQLNIYFILHQLFSTNGISLPVQYYIRGGFAGSRPIRC